VLIAVIDSAFFTATYSEEGSVLYRILLQVRNTQRQYVRISVAKEFEVWTTIVAGSAVKPAMDENGLVMIPLKKSSKAAKSKDTAFQVEFIYMIKNTALNQSNRGNLAIEFPFCDMPINQLFCNVFLPIEYNYGEFGGMREVPYWSRSPPAAQSPQSQLRPMAQMQQQMQPQMYNNPNYDDESNVYLEDKKSVSNSSKSGRTRGMLPVKVEMPTIGKEFRFEQLLVAEKHITLKVEYVQKRKAARKRGNRSCC